MNKKFILLVVITIMVLIFANIGFNVYSKARLEKNVDEYRKILDLIKDEDYKTAKLIDGKVCLRDDSFTTIKEIELGFKPHCKLKYIEKRGSSAIFWYSGFDDLDGIMFVNDAWSDEMWNGIVSAKKMQGNAFLVSTH